VGALTYAVLAMLFPGDVIQIEAPEKPVRTGDDKVDELFAEGKKSLAEMRRLRESISNSEVQSKTDNLIEITDNIFNKLLVEPGVYNHVKRFADFFLPTTIKLLNSYEKFGQSGVTGENITGTMERINTALDTTISSYKKFYDSLYENQALDIEAEISVQETMLKKDGLLETDLTDRRKE